MKSYKIGEMLVKGGMLFSVDSFRCPICEKTILSDPAQSPICEMNTDRADSIIASMAARGYNTYGKD